MSIFLQFILGTAAVFVIFGVIWVVLTNLRTPIGCGRGTGVYTIISVTDNAPDLEQTLKGLVWLQENEMVLGQIIIADCGMDEEGKTLARIAAKKYGKITLLKAEEVYTWITQKT